MSCASCRRARHNVHGGPDPATWYYRITTYGPSGSTTVIVPATDTIHVKYAIHPATTLARCRLHCSSGARRAVLVCMRSLRTLSPMRAPGARGYVLPMPQAPDSDDPDDADPNRQLRADIAGPCAGKPPWSNPLLRGSGRGRLLPPRETGFRNVSGSTHRKLPSTCVATRAMAVLGALGVPPQLFHANGTTPIREALRTWLHLGITPLAELVAEELTRKLGVSVELDFSRLYASDITSRSSRALSQMVTAGMDLAEARRLTGLE